MTTTTVEFAVQISCDSCISKIENSLKDVKGIKQVTVSKEKGTVLVESDVPSSVIQEKIESTGRKAVLKGYGGENGETMEFNFVKVDVDSSGCCGICLPIKNEASRDDGDAGDKENSAQRKRSKGDDGKSDEEEVLELNYSSDSDVAHGDMESRLNLSDGDDIWKIQDDLEADFDVIDEEGEDTEDIKADRKSEERTEENKDEPPEKRQRVDKKAPKTNSQKFIQNLKAAKIKRGDLNTNNFAISLMVYIMLEDESSLTEDEAQEIQETLLKQVFESCHRMKISKDNLPLKFNDCKLVKEGWVLVTCNDKNTLDWILSFDFGPVNDKKVKVVRVLDRMPLEEIKFVLKTTWFKNTEKMLKLIYLQNRNMDTTRWVFKDRKSNPSSMDYFTFDVDLGSIRAMEKLNWNFFYELFTIKVIEHKGKLISSITKGRPVKLNKPK